MNRSKNTVAIVLLAAMLLTFAAGCAGQGHASLPEGSSALSDLPQDQGSASPEAQPDDTQVPETGTVEAMSLDYVPEPEATGYTMPEPEATGVLTVSNAKAALDYSNTADGYVMVRYMGANQKVKVILTGPSGTGYTYNLRLDGEFDILPLSDGSGQYKLGVYENISGTKYSTAFSQSFTVTLEDEFAPFLRPNKYVDFTSESKTAAKAAELTAKDETVLEIIDSVYTYTINNISYDYELAKTVKSGYFPNVDAVLASGKGICFDYAAVMTAMLRSLGIPTKLVVGYAGSVYHAWINVYSQETGWIEASIYFDGSQWKLMDPTFASNANSSEEIMAYIGNGANYSVKYLY